MKIVPVTDASFAPYGRIVEGYPVEAMLNALAQTPVTDGVEYVGRVESLHAVENADYLGELMYGGMPFQLGYCNGHNTKLNCLEYHRASEHNIAVSDLVLLLAAQQDMEGSELPEGKIVAFFVPRGTTIEVYATTLHFCPCEVSADGFRCIVILPRGTNHPLEKPRPETQEGRLLWAKDKWLIAHAEAPAVERGAFVGIHGENYEIHY